MGSCCFKRKNTTLILPLMWNKGELIGRGAYGKVYQCLNQLTGELHAVKCINLVGTRDQVEREVSSLNEEILFLQTHSHPNIIHYISATINPESTGVNIIMEYMPGGSLRQILDKFGGFEEKITALYVRQVLRGLKYLHKKGIIHRDIKAANILLSQEGIIKLSDFGSYKKLRSSNSNCKDEICKSLKGSPYWMAPEVANRSGHSFTADIWSLGCLTIELLAGDAPWSSISTSIKEVMKLISECQRPPIPDGISADCRNFIELCLRIIPSERPSANYLLKHRFIKKNAKVDPDNGNYSD